ncbi:MAG: hypothetical protein VXX11_00320 [Planctomycetota bacterium]|nr:hypothetical protein [Planctomycetota bacterium]MEC8389402.1 hypothetical protein [Planctomycetota bacterium]MEC8410622.1 hypothetical protein [Planctomycetota bacterium]MEC8861493.1 hypothetical protein [Planctomycetota bacterium]
MSDAQWAKICEWLASSLQDLLTQAETTLGSLTTAQWLITVVFVITFGFAMMRGVGLKKFG